MRKIHPCLWFDGRAEEAAGFYASVFRNSRILRTARFGEAGPGPKGSVLTVEFQLEGTDFVALNGGPGVAFTPAVSFHVGMETRDEVDDLWGRLSERGRILMDLGSYPFSERYGWIEDSFGLSWQLNHTGQKTRITPFLMFVGRQGRAEEAIRMYTSIFENSRIDHVERFGKGERGPEGAVKHARFFLGGSELMAMDGGPSHAFSFTPAVSFFVECGSQTEIDTKWMQLSEGGKEGQCGWLTDRYGVSWQVVPESLRAMVGGMTPASDRVLAALMKMGKLDERTLRDAYDSAEARKESA